MSPKSNRQRLVRILPRKLTRAAAGPRRGLWGATISIEPCLARQNGFNALEKIRDWPGGLKIMKRVNPASMQWLICRTMIGTPKTGNKALGRPKPKLPRRDPVPPARIITVTFRIGKTSASLVNLDPAPRTIDQELRQDSRPDRFTRVH